MRKRAADVVEEQIETLRISMTRSIEVLNSIASLHAVSGRMERGQFGSFVRESLNRQRELQALSWNPVVKEGERAAFEAGSDRLIRELGPGGQMGTAAARSEYVPVGFIEPLEGNATALGYDLSSDPLRRASLERARDAGKAIGTGALRLAQGPTHEAGFLVMLPIYRGGTPGTVMERRERIAGYAVAVFRVAELVKVVFEELRRKGVVVELRDVAPNGALILSTAGAGPGAFATTELEFAEHRWAVNYATTGAFVGAAGGGLQSWAALLAGLAFTGMATAYLRGAWRRGQEAAEANAALQVEVAERKRAELAAASANQAKSNFLANMSHEIRTPLNAILGYAQLMARNPRLSPDERDSVGGIAASGRHLLGLINETLDLAKIEAGRMDLNPIDFDSHCFAENIVATFRPLCAQKRIGLRVSVADGGRRRLRGDEGKLRQIVINLVGNAVRFTEAGEVYLGMTALPEGVWRFEVVDTGMGIPDDERATIFEPFHQGKGAQRQGGTGLGLAIARRQVELMGGNLELESERGIGSRFFFSLYFPEARGAAVETCPREPQEETAKPVYAGRVHLPEGLWGRLMIAAELHSATALKTCLVELRGQGEGASQLAEAIGQRLRSCDMDGIQRLLDSVAAANSGDLEHEIERC